MGIRLAMEKAEAPNPTIHELGLGGKQEIDMILIYLFSKYSSRSTIFLSLLRQALYFPLIETAWSVFVRLGR